MVAEDRVVVFDEITRWNITDFEYTNKNKLKNDLPSKWKSTPEEFIKLVRFNPKTQKCYLNESGNVSVMDDETKVEPPGEIPIRPMEDEEYVKAFKATLAYLINSHVIGVKDKAALEEELNMNFNVTFVSLMADVEKVKVNNEAYAAAIAVANAATVEDDDSDSDDSNSDG